MIIIIIIIISIITIYYFMNKAVIAAVIRTHKMQVQCMHANIYLLISDEVWSRC